MVACEAMVGIARACPLFTKLVDSLSPISIAAASTLKNAGIGAVGRYLENLSATERDGLFAAGLGILPLSEAPSSPLTKDFGLARAETLLAKAATIGVPAGAHLMVDFEAQQGAHADVLAYDEAVTFELARNGYVPLVYVGADQPLSGVELYAIPDAHLYWRGGSLNIPNPTCGFAIWQIPPLDQTISGMHADMNLTGADLRGRQPLLWWPS